MRTPRERRRVGLVAAAAFLTVTALTTRGPAPVVRAAGGVVSLAAVHQDVSGPLRALRTPHTLVNGEEASGESEDEGEEREGDGPARDRDHVREGDHDTRRGRPSHDRVEDYLLAHGHTSKADAVRQHSVAAADTPVSTGASFEGVGAGFTGPQGTFPSYYFPPDPNIAVGPNRIVETVNVDLAVFDKSGTVLYGPVQTNTVFSGFGGHCESDNNGDPIVQYDALADRWLISQFANVASSTGPYYECVAVSQTSDPLGAYNRYAFQYSQFPDYPKIGVWPDAYYVTYNMFTSSVGSFAGGAICALDRSAMLAGAAATQQCFSSSYGGLLPSDLDGTTPPPAGAPDRVLAMTGSSNSLGSWSFHVDWANPASSTFTGPVAVPVSPYAAACGSTQCIPEPGGGTLQSLGDRLMYRLAYRNFGDHEAWVVDHSITSGSTVGTRWYELRTDSTGALQVYQQSTFSPDSSARWMGSLAMDAEGDIGLGYSLSSTTKNPSIYVTGRLGDDTPGQMTVPETAIVDGPGYQTQGGSSRNRWGDYTSMRIDPADQCTFWYVNEYHAVTGQVNWNTRIASFALPGCGASVSDFSVSAAPFTASVTAGAFSRRTTVRTARTSGAAQSLALSASGLPAGATAAFGSTTISTGGSTTLTVKVTASTPPGTYPVQVTATGPSKTHRTYYTLVVKPPPSYLSVSDVRVGEAAGHATVTVTRTGSLSGAITASVATTSGSATAGSDYTAISAGSISFADGQATQTIQVPVLQDALDEPVETFGVKIYSPTGTTVLSDDTGQVSILDDDGPVYLSVNDVTVPEGTSTAHQAVFKVVRSGRTDVPVTVSVTTSNGTATAGSDYTALAPTTLSFAAGETTRTVTVDLTPDSVDEPDETFSLKLSNAVGATIRDTSALGTITDDDAGSWFSVGDLSVTEGDSGTKSATFTLTRSGSRTGPASVSVATGNGSAQAGSDYTALPATTVTFDPGVATRTVSVPVIGDTVDEADETFVLRLSAAVGGSISDDTGVATIVDNDASTFLSVRDVTLTEGTGGTTSADFTIERSGRTAYAAGVDVSTSNGTAVAGSDYTALPTTHVDLPAGVTSAVVSVPVLGDSTAESNETFSLRLANAVGAGIDDNTGVATIVDDDGAVTPGPSSWYAVDDVNVNEAAGSVSFTVRRYGSTSAAGSVSVSTSNGTASAGSDYTGLPATAVSFPAGSAHQAVDVPVTQDTLDEPAEYFTLRLANPSGGVLADDSAVATIADDDATPYLSVGDLTTTEGTGPDHDVTFTVTRSGDTSAPVSVGYATADSTATAGSDYTAVAPGTLSFGAGETTKQVHVTVHGDALDEPAETFRLRLSSPVGATVRDDTGLATIVDDDANQTLAITDATTVEGASGTHTVSLTVTRAGSTAGPVSVSYQTANGSATTANGDYVGIPTSTLVIPAGQASATVAVTVDGDVVDEPDETFDVRLTAPSGATLSDDTGTVTIVNDDAPSYAAVRDLLVQEGNTGTTTATVTIVRSGNVNRPATLWYSTSNGSATAGSDYTGIPSTQLSFAAGQTKATVSVTISGDTTIEPDEAFGLRIFTPTDLTISDDTGVVTIENDDG